MVDESSRLGKGRRITEDPFVSRSDDVSKPGSGAIARVGGRIGVWSTVIIRIVQDENIGTGAIALPAEDAHQIVTGKRPKPLSEPHECLLAEVDLGLEDVEEPFPFHGRCDQDYPLGAAIPENRTPITPSEWSESGDAQRDR
jgi:hypothetical protein